jgi:hypothetical protein
MGPQAGAPAAPPARPPPAPQRHTARHAAPFQATRPRDAATRRPQGIKPIERRLAQATGVRNGTSVASSIRTGYPAGTRVRAPGPCSMIPDPRSSAGPGDHGDAGAGDGKQRTDRARPRVSGSGRPRPDEGGERDGQRDRPRGQHLPRLLGPFAFNRRNRAQTNPMPGPDCEQVRFPRLRHISRVELSRRPSRRAGLGNELGFEGLGHDAQKGVPGARAAAPQAISAPRPYATNFAGCQRFSHSHMRAHKPVGLSPSPSPAGKRTFQPSAIRPGTFFSITSWARMPLPSLPPGGLAAVPSFALLPKRKKPRPDSTGPGLHRKDWTPGTRRIEVLMPLVGRAC